MSNQPNTAGFIQITTIADNEDIRQVLALQQANLSTRVSDEIASSQGFVTVQHNFDLLQKMNGAVPQVIAKAGDQVVGYALVMLPSFQDLVPVLKPMFVVFDGLDYDGKKVSDYRYYVMGQICVADGYRGMGIFDGLYLKHKELFSGSFDFCITEIATRNTRSLRAHRRVGFETIHTFRDETDLWEIVVWDWSGEK
ncbi:MAG: GNAT family N-acetyltransferase [Bacteroidetes bacterium]|nr:GNAT family N-acetyltransferase [Bacteroidota bacterium]